MPFARAAVAARPAAAGAAGYDSAVLADSPAGYWRCDETSGTVVTDSSGNARNLFKDTGVTVAASTVMPSGARSYDFLGASAASNVDTTDAAWQSPHAGASGQMTLECWARFDSLSAIATLHGKNASGQAEYLFAVTTTGAVQLALFTLAAGTVATATSATGVIVAGATNYHIAGTYDRAGNFAKVYVNGAEVATTTTAANSADGTAPFFFGVRSSASDRIFNGQASHLAIYPTALSAARVLAHYTAA